MYRIIKSIILIAVIVFSCQACKSDDEKADAHIQKGNDYFASEQYKNAELEYRNALQLQSESVDAWLKLAETLFKLGKAKESFQAYSKVEQLAPGNTDALLKLSGFYFLGKQYDKASERIESILAKEPDNIDALFVKAQILTQENNSSEAETIYNKILSIDPKHTQTLQGLAQIRSAQQDYGATETLLKQSADIDEADIKSRLTLVSFYINRKEFDKAEEQLKKTAELNPESADIQMILGNFYFRMKNESSAEQAYKKAIELAPDNIKAYMTLAGFYDITGNDDKALITYEKAISIQPDNDSARITFARFHYNNRNMEQAEKLVSEILAVRPKFYPARLMKSEFLLFRMQFQDALKILEDLSVEEPKDARVHYFMGLSQIGLGQNDRAKASVVKAVELNPDYELAHLLLAEIYYQERSYDLAYNEASIITRKDPANYKAQLVIANTQMRTGKNQEAENGFLNLINIDPENPVAYYRLGILKSFLNDFEGARKYLNTALTKNPLLMDVFALLVRNRLVQKDYDAAHELCDRQLAVTQGKPVLQGMVYNLQGDVYIAQKKPDSAKEYYTKAIEANSEFLKPYLSLAALYLSEKNKEKAVEQYQIMIDKKPNLPTPYMMLGTLYEMDRDFTKAEGNYRKALELNPEFAAAANNLAYILAEQGGNYDEALKFARIAKEKMPNDPRVMDTLGMVYFKKELYGNAVNEFLDSLEQAPDNALIHYHLGMAYHARGEMSQAKEAFTRALELNPGFDGSENARNLLATIKE